MNIHEINKTLAAYEVIHRDLIRAAMNIHNNP